EDFHRAFLSLPAEARAAAFDALFDGPRPSHAALLSLAGRSPEGDGGRSPGPAAGSRCPICRFPTFEWSEPVSSIPEQALARIRAAFPGWIPEEGACRECADRYAVAAAGARSVPPST
ncbi:MAG TPA: hypothetical protein VKF62_06665, partial [Planctomycetota bacterium]|nr:hypothetical protein [Planctomycetota bacterium]